MGFAADSFIFDGTPSEFYNLHIRTSDGGEALTEGSSNVDIISQKIPRRAKPYFYGTEENKQLSFELEFYRETEISATDLGAIQKWLFGHKEYKKLIIVSDDMADICFNVILNNPRIYRVGNTIYGVSCTCQCDAPYAWTFPRVLERKYTGTIANERFTFNNLSDANDYLYPKILLKTSNTVSSFTITNESDSYRVFSFSGLAANEILEINNDLKTIRSSTGLLRLGNFNKKWFRFVPGLNKISVLGNLSTIQILYEFVRKVGG